ncbi:MAG: hypothetical protein RLZZ507_1857 [Cyanobacteriota bacterium]|jgi:hypothetical protein
MIPTAPFCFQNTRFVHFPVKIWLNENEKVMGKENQVNQSFFSFPFPFYHEQTSMDI